MTGPPEIVPLGFIEIVGQFAEASNWLHMGVAGWRFLFSPAFREQTRSRWRTACSGRVLWEVFLGIAGFFVGLLGVAGILLGIFFLIS